MSHIFVSYSRKDLDCVDRIVHALDNEDFPVWIDRKRLKLGDDWVQQITTAVKSASVFLLLWSKNAAASQYVGEEMRIAQNQSFGTQKRTLIITVRLDDTDFPEAFSHKQAYDLDEMCSDNGIQKLIDGIPPRLRQFNYSKTLAQQNTTLVPETPLVSVQYDYDAAWGFSAGIIGPRDERLPKNPKILHVALQFTRGVNFDMINDIIKSYDEDRPNPMWFLHIKGAMNDKDNTYELQNEQTQWEAAADYIQRTIKSAATESTTLRVFAPIPGMLLAGAMRHIDRFWHVQLYHYDRGRGGYFLAVDQPPF